jgi:hypothetical protein
MECWQSNRLTGFCNQCRLPFVMSTYVATSFACSGIHRAIDFETKAVASEMNILMPSVGYCVNIKAIKTLQKPDLI